ncbi:glycoside hydrolase [Rhodobacterales bacterium]|nr:glycoside hydrolase [Rhodobacterales bacterium]
MRLGVNRVNLAWLSSDEQRKILKQIAGSGVGSVRLSLSRPVARSIEAVKIADELGLDILLEIQLTNKSYYPPQAALRSGHGRTWDIHRLSDLDPNLYRRELSASLSAIDAAGGALVAVEPGNEINISPYNGDLHVLARPGAQTARDADGLSDRAAFERGLDTYIEILRITRQTLRSTKHSADAALVSAGLSDMGPELADKLGFERLEASEVIAMLRERGIDQIVDGYGIHIYPGRRSGEAVRSRVLSELRVCGSEGEGKPCWVTEWGIANLDETCPVDDRGRKALIQAAQAGFDTIARAGQLQAAFYYDWDSHDRYSVWRCGGLSPAGALATGTQD